jgi:hypothetical protein
VADAVEADGIDWGEDLQPVGIQFLLAAALPA